MYAVSFLGALTFVEARIDEVRSRRRLEDDPDAWGHADRSLAAICDLVELCSVAIRRLSLEDLAPGAADAAAEAAAIRGLLSQLDHRRGIEVYADDSLDESPYVDVYDNRVVVPVLGPDSPPATWAVLGRYLLDSIERVADRCRTVADRYRHVDVPDLATAWVENATLLEDLASVLARTTATGRWIRTPLREATNESDHASRLAKQLITATTDNS